VTLSPFKTPNADTRCHVLYPTPSPWDPSRLVTSRFLNTPVDFENAEVPSPDSSGSRATCPSNDERLRLNREIATRDFDVHEMLALANPDMPICKWQPDSSGRPRVNSLATPPRSDGLRGFEDLLDDLQVVDSLPLGELSAPPPSFCKDFTEACSLREAKALSLLSFCNSDSFRDLFEHAPCARLRPSPTLNGTEDFPVLCTHSHSNPGLSLLRLATETSIRPALHLHGSNNQITLG
jgi:hypothetical protein